MLKDVTKTMQKNHTISKLYSQIDRKNWVIKIYHISERKIVKDIGHTYYTIILFHIASS